MQAYIRKIEEEAPDDMEVEDGEHEGTRTITIATQGEDDGNTVYAQVSDGTYQAVVTDASQVKNVLDNLILKWKHRWCFQTMDAI